ncbi:hypothetical protein [Persephonella sp.]|nr:hypothetical protein [Aquificota bacterium]
MDVLEGFLKKLEHEIKHERQKLYAIEKEIARLRLEERKLKEEYRNLEEPGFPSDVFSILVKNNYMQNILKRLKKIQSRIEKLEQDAEAVRVIIKEKNAEKKAIRNYKKKLENEKNIEELRKETQLIDEIFNRKR